MRLAYRIHSSRFIGPPDVDRSPRADRVVLTPGPVRARSGRSVSRGTALPISIVGSANASRANQYHYSRSPSSMRDRILNTEIAVLVCAGVAIFGTASAHEVRSSDADARADKRPNVERAREIRAAVVSRVGDLERLRVPSTLAGLPQPQLADGSADPRSRSRRQSAILASSSTSTQSARPESGPISGASRRRRGPARAARATSASSPAKRARSSISTSPPRGAGLLTHRVRSMVGGGCCRA